MQSASAAGTTVTMWATTRIRPCAAAAPATFTAQANRANLPDGGETTMARSAKPAGRQWQGGGMLQWLGLAFIILLADQFTKVLIVGYYHLGDSTYVTSFFNVVRAHNTGAAFSSFNRRPRAGSAGFHLRSALSPQGSFCGCYAPTPVKSCFVLPWLASWVVPLAT